MWMKNFHVGHKIDQSTEMLDSKHTYREYFDQLRHGTLRLELILEHPHGLVIEIIVGWDPAQGHWTHTSLILWDKSGINNINLLYINKISNIFFCWWKHQPKIFYCISKKNFFFWIFLNSGLFQTFNAVLNNMNSW